MLAKAWKPTYLNGCKLWLRADSGVNIAPAVSSPTTGMVLWLKADAIAGSDGDAVSTWNDSSGNSNNATAVGTNPVLKKAGNGINGKNVVRINGPGGDMLQGSFNPGSTGMTIFYVARVGAAQSLYASVFNSSGGSGTSGVEWSFAVGNAMAGTGAGYAGTTGAIGLGDVAGTGLSKTFLGQYRYDRANWTVGGVNGVVAADTSWPSGTFNYGIGQDPIGAPANGKFTGDVAELIVYTTALSASDIAQTHAYLLQKYGGTRWADQSGLGNDVEQIDIAEGPTFNSSSVNGHPGFSIGASANGFLNTSTGLMAAGHDRHIFVIAKPATSGGGTLFSQRTSLPDSTWDVLQIAGVQYFWSDGTAQSSTNTAVDYTNMPIGVEYVGQVGSDPGTRINGSTIVYDHAANVTSDTGANGFGVGMRAVSVGSLQQLVGDICEVIVFDNVKSGQDLLSIRGYLNARYGVS
jgi:hypothetical protein